MGIGRRSRSIFTDAYRIDSWDERDRLKEIIHECDSYLEAEAAYLKAVEERVTERIT